MDTTGVMTNCPNCNATIASEAAECGHCGVLFSKWQQRETNVAEGNMARYANATSSGFNWTILVIIATIIALTFIYLNYANNVQ